jgi:hypothetical protein
MMILSLRPCIEEQIGIINKGFKTYCRKLFLISFLMKCIAKPLPASALGGRPATPICAILTFCRDTAGVRSGRRARSRDPIAPAKAEEVIMTLSIRDQIIVSVAALLMLCFRLSI